MESDFKLGEVDSKTRVSIGFNSQNTIGSLDCALSRNNRPLMNISMQLKSLQLSKLVVSGRCTYRK